ncbi:hypothetical protein IPV09_12335 [Tessaracoccus sp. SD287]|uniref:hypothetical protein n=1 Tax=Tessaracoccus sp. SD287 TaxID=2782008 RepID=UPI001A968540|nr:hypothetical protein [Tessaracoccus sp. SD287]MBO1032124.1 hypothetical protein [Tessaracoccus sp. SD287]
MLSVVIGLLLVGLAACVAVLLAFRRHENRVQLDAEVGTDGCAVSRSLAEADLALFRADLAAQSHSVRELAELGDPLADELREDLDALAATAGELAPVESAADEPEVVRRAVARLSRARQGLAELAARIGGEPKPAVKPPCFFNPNHGPSATVVAWTTSDAIAARVPSCSADAERLRSGANPYSRTVSLQGRRVAWWEAGEIVRPWARGWFEEWLNTGASKRLASSFPSLAHDPPPEGDPRQSHRRVS